MSVIEGNNDLDLGTDFMVPSQVDGNDLNDPLDSSNSVQECFEEFSFSFSKLRP